VDDRLQVGEGEVREEDGDRVLGPALAIATRDGGQEVAEIRDLDQDNLVRVDCDPLLGDKPTVGERLGPHQLQDVGEQILSPLFLRVHHFIAINAF